MTTGDLGAENGIIWEPNGPAGFADSGVPDAPDISGVSADVADPTTPADLSDAAIPASPAIPAAPAPASPEDEAFMRLALAEADLAALEGEVPIGAVVVCGGEVVARAHNRRETAADPSAHAEFSAMVEASRVLGRWRLTGCTVYVTLEPCLMCAGLMVNARVDRCVYGAPDPKGGAVGTLYDVSHDPRLNHEFQVDGGVLEQECADQLRAFFRRRRAEAREAALAARSEGER